MTAIASGSDYIVGYRAESVFGTFEDSAGAFTPLVPVTNVKTSFMKDILESKGIGFNYVQANQYGKEEATVSLEGELTDSFMAFAYTILAATEAGYSIWVKDSTASVNYKISGCRPSKLKLSTSAGEVVKLTFELSCTKATTGAVSTSTLAAPSAITPINWSLTSVTPGGSLNATITGYSSWEISLDYGVMKKFGFVATTPRRIQRTGYAVSGKITSDFEDLNQLTDFLNGDQGTLVFNFDTGATLGAGYDALTVFGVRYENIDLDIKPWDLVELPLSFKGTTAVFG